MLARRTITVIPNAYAIGDVIDITLIDGEEVEAMAVSKEDDGTVFLLVDCLTKEEHMNPRNTKLDGYADSDLREKLNSEIVYRFPAEIRDVMIPFANGDFLRLPTEKEILGKNECCEKEQDSVTQFEPMKLRRNRIAFRGKNGAYDWYWLQNNYRHGDKILAVASYGEHPCCVSSCCPLAVRPAFKI